MEAPEAQLPRLIGESKFQVWSELRALIESLYRIEPQWNPGGKKWTFECKYRKATKTLCALYAKENTIGFMVIFGAAERAKFEAERQAYSTFIQDAYDAATTYHDGKWMMLELHDSSGFDDLRRLLALKRKPQEGK